MVYNIHEDLVTLPQKLQIQQLPKPPEKKKKAWVQQHGSTLQVAFRIKPYIYISYISLHWCLVEAYRTHRPPEEYSKLNDNWHSADMCEFWWFSGFSLELPNDVLNNFAHVLTFFILCHSVLWPEYLPPPRNRPIVTESNVRQLVGVFVIELVRCSCLINTGGQDATLRLRACQRQTPNKKRKTLVEPQTWRLLEMKMLQANKFSQTSAKYQGFWWFCCAHRCLKPTQYWQYCSTTLDKGDGHIQTTTFWETFEDCWLFRSVSLLFRGVLFSGDPSIKEFWHTKMSQCLDYPCNMAPCHGIMACLKLCFSSSAHWSHTDNFSQFW